MATPQGSSEEGRLDDLNDSPNSCEDEKRKVADSGVTMVHESEQHFARSEANVATRHLNMKQSNSVPAISLGTHYLNVKTVPRKVYVRVNLYDLPEIDTMQQSFLLNFYYEACWVAKIDSKGNVLEKDLDFDPKIGFGNMVGEPLAQSPWRCVEYNYCGTGHTMVCLRCKLTSKFMAQVRLRRFPFDVQDIVVSLRSDVPEGECTLLNNTMLLSQGKVWEFTTSNEYNYAESLFVKETAKTSTRSKFSTVQFRLVAYRKPGFIINNVFVPIIVISVLGLTVFTFKEEEVNEDFEKRFELNGGLLLTLVAYKFSASSSIPKVGYLTLADKFVLFSIFFQVALIVWSAILVNTCTGCQDAIDFVGFWLFLSIWLAWFIFSMVVFCVKDRRLGFAQRGYLNSQHQRNRTNGVACVCDWLSRHIERVVPTISETDKYEIGWETIPLVQSNNEPSPLLSPGLTVPVIANV
mmetsp:Transcript_1182/g.1852  ORF Transcript_1182/g.1852 Transcript_1182/m.1852 type:complete len:465 (-) Transcript_1182:44-1438(-)